MKTNIQMCLYDLNLGTFQAGDGVCFYPGLFIYLFLIFLKIILVLSHQSESQLFFISYFFQPWSLVSCSRSSHSAFLVGDVVPSTWYLVFLWLQHCFDQSGSGAWVSNPPKPILATLCLAHWHSDPMPLRLWTQILEKPYRFFKHIISGWGFKNITNHLKVLVQCGSIILVLGAHLLAWAL